jgi:hypothetical protein
VAKRRRRTRLLLHQGNSGGPPALAVAPRDSSCKSPYRPRRALGEAGFQPSLQDSDAEGSTGLRCRRERAQCSVASSRGYHRFRGDWERAE